MLDVASARLDAGPHDARRLSSPSESPGSTGATSTPAQAGLGQPGERLEALRRRGGARLGARGELVVERADRES